MSSVKVVGVIAILVVAVTTWYILDARVKSSAPTPINSNFEIPLEEKALFAYLQSGKYKEWKNKESEVHDSAGPHKRVRAFINDTLALSLAKNSKEHPKGSIVIKEQFSKSGNSLGWAVMVKTQAKTDSGKGWFWYEVTSNKDINKKVAFGNGVELCSSCHSASNRDMILIPFPLK